MAQNLPAARASSITADLSHHGRQVVAGRAVRLGPATGLTLDDLAAASIFEGSPSTVRNYQLGQRRFADWCDDNGIPYDFPRHAVTPEAVALFIDAMAADGLKPATLNTYVAAVSKMHKRLNLPSPADTQIVKDAKASHIKRLMSDDTGDRGEQQQAAPMRWEAVGPALDAMGDLPIDLRDRALILMAYETGARASELCALRWRDLKQVEAGAVVTVYSTKTGSVRQAPLPASSYAAVQAWGAAIGVEPDAPIFCPLSSKSGDDTSRLTRRDVSRVFAARVGPWARGDKALSAHSARVGKAQDLRAAGFSSGDIAQAMGWKTDAMPNRYTRHLAAWDNAAARLAQMQGRA